MLSGDSNRFVPIVSIYFKLYFASCIIFQCVLLYLIFTKSPSVLSNLKFFLINTSFIQVLHACSVFFSQERIIPNTSSTAILHDGPCRIFGPNICFASHHFVLAFALGSGLAVASTVIFRHRTLRMGNFNGKRVVFIISSVYVPVVIMIILPFTVPWDFETVRLATYKDHPTYNFTIYEPIGGFASNDTFQFIFNTGLVAMSSYVIPVVTGILTKRTLKMINKNSVVSSKTKQQSKTLTYGLALQNILPAFSYVPPATAWIISQFGEVEVLWNGDVFQFYKISNEKYFRTPPDHIHKLPTTFGSSSNFLLCRAFSTCNLQFHDFQKDCAGYCNY
ncbi:hypothetical protein B9Z55_018207 [Caenorhabditis nigoni]|uniref:Serpentine receptor class gamma n=1 Tax=Caenorhabditis nigoni TaxID=1611254 RepID=A0A2G5TCT3_9PELO|nr:hypothetical protein B9Z55_018207 [Caenorhabditis nigoni]